MKRAQETRLLKEAGFLTSITREIKLLYWVNIPFTLHSDPIQTALLEKTARTLPYMTDSAQLKL